MKKISRGVHPPVGPALSWYPELVEGLSKGRRDDVSLANGLETQYPLAKSAHPAQFAGQVTACGLGRCDKVILSYTRGLI